MLIVTAQNVTKVKGKPTLLRKDGTADYDVWVGINEYRIWSGKIYRHVREAGAPKLLRLIANQMEEDHAKRHIRDS